MIKILDSTLREGEQTPGVYFDVHIKTSIAELLNEIGIDIVEIGHPAVTKEIFKAVEGIANINMNALSGAHSRSLKEDVDLALQCGVDFIGIFYCVSDMRLKDSSKDLKLVVKKISDIISYVKRIKPEILIRYTPEDTVRSPWKNVIFAASEAVKAGADIISVADTTGFMVPGTEKSMYYYVKKLKYELSGMGLYPDIAVHCHNDKGLALANAIDGYRAGASIIDASTMGLGERAGIVDLATLLTVLVTDFGYEKKWKLEKLPELYSIVSKYSKIPLPINFPVTGKHAFTHCAGVHTQAAIRNPVHYQSLSPELFGKNPVISLDHMSGIAAVRYSLERIGYLDTPRSFLEEVLDKVKEVGQRGRVVDSSELKIIVRHIEKDKNSKVSA